MVIEVIVGDGNGGRGMAGILNTKCIEFAYEMNGKTRVCSGGGVYTTEHTLEEIGKMMKDDNGKE